MKSYFLIFALVGLNKLVVSAQQQTVPELISCEKSASKPEDMTRFYEEPSDSILKEAVKALQVSEPTLDTVYETYDVEKMPSFPGGEVELLKFVSENLSIPSPSRETNICASAIIRFVVHTNGDLTDFRILKGCFWADQLIKLIESGPCWIPGERNGVPISVSFTIPIRIRIQ